MSAIIPSIFRRTIARRRDNVRSDRTHRSRLMLNNLEDRIAPATFIVNNTLDDTAAGSLRWAIGQANSAAGADDIVFDATVFSSQQTISLASRLPVISNGNLTITNSTGAANAIVERSSSAGSNFGLFEIGASSPNVTFDGITMTGGNSGAGSAITVSNVSNLTVKNSVVANNTGGVGTIYLPPGYAGLLKVQSSTISGNTGGTGGIYFFSGGSLLVQNSTISGNTGTATASFHGSGIIFYGTVGAAGVTIENSTIVGNTTASVAGGGGVNISNVTGNVTIRNSTITDNTATTTYTYGGGGVAGFYGSATINIISTIIAQNVGPTDGTDLKLAGAATAVGTNSLIGVLPPSGFSGTGNLTGTSGSPLDPLLLDFQDNGGPTFTREPKGDSPTLGTGANPASLISDQRGFGYRRNFGGGVDIGAVERQPPGLPVAVASAQDVGDADAGETTYTFDVLFADPTGTNNGINVSTVIGNNAAVRVTGPGGYDVPATFVSIDDGTNGTPRTATYSITPPGGSWDVADVSRNYFIVVQDSQIQDLDGNFVLAGDVGKFAVGLSQTFIVTNAADSGAGSLRDAIDKANFFFPNDTIVFDAGFFSTHQDINLVTALAPFPSDGGELIVVGPGEANVTVNAGGGFRVFDSQTTKLTMSGMTVTGGLADGSAGVPNGEFGGGLRAVGIVTLDHMVFTGNTAIGNSYFDLGAGGAIGMGAGGALMITNSTISGNTAEQKGGGIFFRNGGSLVIESSTISGNTTTPVGGFSGYYGGGGIFVLFNANNNPPPGFTPGAMVVANSTIANNTSTGSGGGIGGLLFGGTLLIQNSTISGNNADFSSPGFGGGGIALEASYYGDITLQNSIVSGNTNGNSPDIQSNYTVNAYSSLIGSASGFTLSGSSSGNIVGANAFLGPLQDNGGPTQTMLALPGSPAIDAGSNALIPTGITTDQRGTIFTRTFGDAVDMGAIEDQPIDDGPFVRATTPPVSIGGTIYFFTVKYADPLGTNNGINVATVIDNDAAVRIIGPDGFDAPATFVSIDNATDGAPRIATYSIVPPGGSWNGTDSGIYTVQMQANQVADLDGNFAPAGQIGAFAVDAPQTVIVTNADDAGIGSLRAAMDRVAATRSTDIITFDPGFFNTHQDILLVTALPSISRNGGGLTIAGPGVANLTVNAGGNFRVFDSNAPTLTLSDFTVTGGLADNSVGGGLRASGIVTVDNMAFVSNVATGTQFVVSGGGGGIAMARDSFLKVSNSTISGNNAGRSGGGILMYFGGLVLENSTISGNSATFGGAYLGYSGGGGLAFLGTPSASPPAGFTPYTAVILNSTIVGNTTTGSGGGLVGFNQFGSPGIFLVQNSTVSGNNADSSGTSSYGYPYGGGGLSIMFGGNIVVRNSVVSGNTNATSPDIQSQYSVDTSFSLIGNISGFTDSNGAGNVTPGTDPLLGPLQNNGGPTFTMLPAAGSPLIDAGSNSFVPGGVITDQRGFGYYRNYNGTVDIGSLEVQPPGLPFVVANTPPVVPGATTYFFTVLYADPTGTNNGIDVSTVIGNNNAVRVTGPFGFDVPATFVVIDNGTNGTPRTATYSITPPGGSWNNFDNGVYTVQMQANQVADIDGNFVPALQIGSVIVLIPPLVVVNADDSGDGSLRSAIALANSTADDDVIVFDPGFFNTHQDINLQSALPTITANGGGLTITGPGVANLTVNGGDAFRVLDSNAPTLDLSGFTVTGGLADGSTGIPNGEFGGGLRAGGVVTLDNMVFTGNQAVGSALYFDVGAGGAIGMKNGGALMVRNSTIDGNFAERKGGGIFFRNGGALVIENSTISGNSATPTATYAGLYGGGGILFLFTADYTPPPGFVANSVVIRNSTIANNTTTGSGGGINGLLFSGTFLLQNSTISGNNADATGNNEFGYPNGGGGIALEFSYGGSILLQNSVVSGNTNADAPDIVSYFPDRVTAYYSLIGSPAGFTLNPASGNNLIGVDAMLGPLQDNGGPTQTMAPLAGSPLINAGSLALIPAGVTTDQRGGTFDRAFGSSVDIGSFEAQPVKVTIDQAVTQTDPTNGSTIVFTVHFSLDVTGFDGTDIVFTGSTVGGTLVAGVTGSGSDYTVTVTGMAGQGTVVASIPAGAATDLFGTLNAASTSIDNTVTFDALAPSVTIDQAAGQADPTSLGPIVFTVQFSEIVTGFDGSDISFAGSTVGGALVASVTGAGADYTVSVSGMAGEGTIVASIPGGAALDQVGNGSNASTSIDNNVTFDNLAPSVTINQAVGQNDPTNVPSISFDVKFSEVVTGFTASDVSLLGSTAGGTLVVNVSGSGDTYTVTVTGITSRGLVVVSIPAGGANDAIGNLNLDSTSTDNSVEFVNAGTVGFSAAAYATNEEAVSRTITVSRTGGNEGVVTIQYATSNGTAHSGGSATTGQADYTPTTGTLSWADGESGDKTFSIPIGQDTLNEGKELLNLTLSNATGSPSLGTIAATVAIAPSDGSLPGKYLDQDGDKINIKLNGRTGSLLWFRTDPDGDSRGPIELIELTGTLPDPLKPKAALVILVTKANKTTDGTVGLGAITGTGLKSISARKTNLDLEGINLTGYLGSLTIGNILNGADITTGATTNIKQVTRINSLAISDGTAISVGAPIANLTATRIGVGSIVAPSIANMNVRGQGKPTVIGDMASDITLSGLGLAVGKSALGRLTVAGSIPAGADIVAPSVGTITVKKDMAGDITISGVGVDVTKKALGTLTVKGAVLGSDIFVTGNVGTVTVGAFRDSRLFAGYTGPDNGIGGSFNFPATVTTFKATGKVDGFQNSRVIATNFKTVTIINLDSTNSLNKFGFYADTSLGTRLGSITVKSPTLFKFNPLLPTPQSVGDFEVRIV